MIRTAVFYIGLFSVLSSSIACAQTLFSRDFEANNGGFSTSGTNSSWAWGIPNKQAANANARLTAAAGGQRCWMSGGLNNFYGCSEASYLTSPVIDLSSAVAPYLEFNVFVETEQRWDFVNIQYSTNGTTWQDLGQVSGQQHAYRSNWMNYTVSGQPTWSGNSGDNVRDLNTTVFGTAACNTGGSGIQYQAGCTNGLGCGQWVLARHCLGMVAGQSAVQFRFFMSSGQLWQDEGFAIDNFRIAETAVSTQMAPLTIGCVGEQVLPQLTIQAEGQALMALTDWQVAWFVDGVAQSASGLTPSFSLNTPGIHTIRAEVTDPCGGISFAERALEVVQPTALFTASPQEAPVPFSVSATPSQPYHTYRWQLDGMAVGQSNQPLSLPLTQPGIYMLEMFTETAEGCATSEQVVILALVPQPVIPNLDSLFFVPNVFTPNGDGVNDFFGIVANGPVLGALSIHIYNRLGKEVYTSTSRDFRWLGADQPEGVYFYRLEYQHTSAQGTPKQTRAGQVTLIR